MSLARDYMKRRRRAGLVAGEAWPGRPTEMGADNAFVRHKLT
jgi:hypothetical protein